MVFLSCRLAVGGPDSIHAGGLHHALAIPHVLPRTGDLRDVDLVADPLVLLAGRILILDDNGRVHLVVFHGMDIGGLYLHEGGIQRRTYEGCDPCPRPAGRTALGKAPFGGAESRAVLDFVENRRGRQGLVRPTADRAHLEVPVHLVVDGEVLALTHHQIQVVAIASRNTLVINFYRHDFLLC